MKKWDGSTDSGSQYFRLRQTGLSHDDAVATIEGRYKLNMNVKLFCKDNGQTAVCLWFGSGDIRLVPQNYRYLTPSGKMVREFYLDGRMVVTDGWFETGLDALKAVCNYLENHPKCELVKFVRERV